MKVKELNSDYFSYLIKKEVTDGPLKNQLWM